MKRKMLFFIFMLALAPIISAQGVDITPEKKTYTRRNVDSAYKEKFTVNYPRVKAADAVLAKKIESALSFEENFQISFKEEVEDDIRWLDEADFDVKYNNDGVLCASLFITGTGAYETTSTRNVVVDLRSGKKIAPADVFANLDGLLARIKEIQKDEIETGLEEIKSDPDYQELRGEIDDELKNADFTAADLDGFYLDEKGVTFVYDYGFRHAIRALEPGGEYFMSWTELTPYIKSGGLLGKFIR